jgi:acetyltransferase-like isoleucine patch superfamily enzyme
MEQEVIMKGVRVGSDLWFDASAVVLDGVSIGDGAVIGAGAIVTKDVPSGAVVVGTAARVLRLRSKAV